MIHKITDLLLCYYYVESWVFFVTVTCSQHNGLLMFSWETNHKLFKLIYGHASVCVSRSSLCSSTLILPGWQAFLSHKLSGDYNNNNSIMRHLDYDCVSASFFAPRGIFNHYNHYILFMWGVSAELHPRELFASALNQPKLKMHGEISETTVKVYTGWDIH